MRIDNILLLAMCGFAATVALTAQASQAPPAQPTKAAAATPATTTPPAPPRENGLYATVVTSMGNITLRLYEKESPLTVKNFIELSRGRKEWTDPQTRQRVKRPLYTGAIFHRVIPGFMIQGGDPTGTGMGGTDVIPDEFDPSLSFDTPGKLAMANAGPGTGSCQFFITEVPTPHLNGKHTIFGQVLEGQDLVGKIARVPVGQNDKPTTPVKILRTTFLRVGPGAPVDPVAPVRKPTATSGTTPKKAATPPAKK
jgi:peptidyl-prolyl cis-trans isomerase A (cyclophilin A)